METRSNNVLVGAFVLFFVAALAIFVVWLANDSGGTKREYDIYFKQSVDGLNKGAQVQYSGVPVGQVRQIAVELIAALDRRQPRDNSAALRRAHLGRRGREDHTPGMGARQA